jgi:hypothetical protein
VTQPLRWRAKQRPAQAPTWEREVQASIRTSTPPAGPRDWLLLGEAGDELAAVVWAEQSSGPGEVYATIWWYVDRRNRASETLCERLGAIHHRQAHDRFDRWSISYDLTPR